MASGEGEGGADTREYPCLVRVTDGKDANFSTKVSKITRREPCLFL
jgi:hypothetical protein